MEYRRYGSTYYVRMDRGDEIVSSLLGPREQERSPGAHALGWLLLVVAVLMLLGPLA